MDIIRLIIKILQNIGKVISGCYWYRNIYKFFGLFTTRKFKETTKLHKYAVLVAARNEETVIGQLVDSIRKQDYPSELVDIFVVADNCTDSTAQIARQLGAICYERDDKEHKTKGFALQFLVECIRQDYGIESYDGYFIFDADNLLKQDYITRMNESFAAGEKIVTSYRNTKNFDDNWISASYGVHWLRTVRNEHRARSFFHLATRIQGTGFLFAHEVIKDGWNYTSLTEDRAFCADAVANGYKISYNNKAEFYDEQPVDMKIAMRQRIRWAKGHLQALAETGPQLLWHIFYTGGRANQSEEAKKASVFKRFINNIRLRFMSFDMLTVVFPNSLFSVFKRWIVYALRCVLIFGPGLKIASNYGPDFIADFLKLIGYNPVYKFGFPATTLLLILTVGWVVEGYLKGIFTAAYVYIFEHKRIKKIKWYRKIWFCITFPIFDQIGKLAMIIALFTKVEWKPIPHKAAIAIDELNPETK
ncbi:MAG: glycosyltransferase family 2 protein [Clostridia bacterium]|nr:glycosyltransferase family 2 protein [Clostridia bacterium]